MHLSRAHFNTLTFILPILYKGVEGINEQTKVSSTFNYMQSEKSQAMNLQEIKKDLCYNGKTDLISPNIIPISRLILYSLKNMNSENKCRNEQQKLHIINCVE